MGPEDGRMGDYVFNQEGKRIWIITTDGHTHTP
jgi:hypothetical protein